LSGSMYLRRFIDDSFGATTRWRTAERLAELPPDTPIAVEVEPAPYSLPPVNLFSRTLVLLPRTDRSETGLPTKPAVLVRPEDVPAGQDLPKTDLLDRAFPARISWAGKHFEVRPLPALGG